MSAIIPMGMLVAVMLAGFGAAKLNLFSEKAEADFSVMVTTIACPALILSTVNSAGILGTKQEALTFLLIAFLLLVLYIPLAHVFTKFLKLPDKSLGVAKFILMINNTGFMGLPIILAMYGEGAMFYAALVNIPTNVFSFSYGAWVMAKHGDSETKNIPLRKILLSPGLLTSLLVVILFIFDIKFPIIVADFFSMVGAMTTPLAMFVIGMTMAKLDLRSTFLSREVYVLAFIKMLLFPVLVYVIFGSFIENPIILSVLIVVAGMPGPAVSTSFAILYDADVGLAARYVFVSTLLSVVTIPLVVNLLGLA